MEAVGLLVTLEARSGKEADADAFLKSAQPLTIDENTLKSVTDYLLAARKDSAFWSQRNDNKEEEIKIKSRSEK